ncbi:MAG: NADH-quinone oxidoreductase subunit C [Planctomycetes bacterium]|nr:NADH-quinone oxidoreductase subunit C [Planctomycetota bacterium]
MGLSSKDILARVKAQYPDVEVVEAPGDAFALVPQEKLTDVARWLRDTPELRFDFPTCVSGVDDKQSFWVVYHLYSVRHNHRAVLKVKLGREEPHVSSVCSIWPGADWHERETYDMYGIVFDGHPDLRRILLPEDWPGYPLRKDYDFPDHYQGIPLK